ncbi:MAG TPA: hypothetical protein PK858_12440, partial [Saprospiraceae bacterium]|nr:hypothetical protein [Saprospiraceae bacterium]
MSINITLRKTAAALAFATLIGAVACTQQGRNEMGNTTKELGQDMSREADRVGNKVENATDKAAAEVEQERKEMAARLQKASDNVNAEIEEADREIKKATAKEKARWEERRRKL